MTKETGKWLDDARPRTRAIRSGIRRTPEGEHAEPIFISSGFLFASPEDAAAKFAGEVDGDVYSRCTNPTVRAFEKRLAALEQGEAAVATASGMSADGCLPGLSKEMADSLRDQLATLGNQFAQEDGV